MDSEVIVDGYITQIGDEDDGGLWDKDDGRELDGMEVMVSIIQEHRPAEARLTMRLPVLYMEAKLLHLGQAVRIKMGTR